MAIPNANDPLEHHAFFPGERDGGGVYPGGQVNLGSGVMNPSAMDGPYGEECGRLWRKLRLRVRMQAIVAHEIAEYESAGDHERVLSYAPEMDLPIRHGAREILRKQEAGWKGR